MDHCGKENTFRFLHNATCFTLYPRSIEEIKNFKGSKRQTEAVKSKADAEGPNQQAASRNKPRQLLSKRRFVRESKDMKVVYAVIPKETLKLASDKSK